jgi:hypothetical protein
MSRSYRKNPFGGCCNPGSEKRAKCHANRKLRHTNKAEVYSGEEETFTIRRESSDVWAFPKDGKMHFVEPTKPNSHTVYLMKWCGLTEDEALEKERKNWKKHMRK